MNLSARAASAACAAAAFVVLYGCGPQLHSSLQHRVISLQPGDLERGGVAIITPSTVTTQEEEKQQVALVFAEVLTAERPSVRCLTLPETLTAINRAGLADGYRRMYADYRDTGIFERNTLEQIGKVTGARYVIQLKLAAFSQWSKGRFSSMGFRIVETKVADVRVFMQIWDTRDGAIVWEGAQEMNLSRDRVSEERITEHEILEKAARNLIAVVP